MTPWTVAHQAALSMGFSRGECWNGLPCVPPGVLPDPGIEPVTLTSPALAGMFFTTSTTWEVYYGIGQYKYASLAVLMGGTLKQETIISF